MEGKYKLVHYNLLIKTSLSNHQHICSKLSAKNKYTRFRLKYGLESMEQGKKICNGRGGGNFFNVGVEVKIVCPLYWFL